MGLEIGPLPVAGPGIGLGSLNVARHANNWAPQISMVMLSKSFIRHTDLRKQLPVGRVKRGARKADGQHKPVFGALGKLVAVRCPRAGRSGMTAGPVPRRHWRRDGDDPLPTGSEALNEPFSAFPSLFLRIECDRCGKVQMVDESHAKWRDRTLRDIVAKMRHDGCG